MPRILVIDDQTFVRAAIKATLATKGFDVVMAESAMHGLQEFKASKFDLAIVDIYMPGMDGVKLIKTLRGQDPNLPVVAISGMILGSTGKTALDHFSCAPELSNVACLQKPFRPNELFAAMQKAMDAVPLVM